MKVKQILELAVDENTYWVDPKHKIEYNSIPIEEIGTGRYYLHGELESFIHYDIAHAINCKTAGYSRQTLNYSEIKGEKVLALGEGDKLTYEMHINGIIPVKVRGIEEDCVGYFWTQELTKVQYEGEWYTIYDQLGLVCLESDKEGRAYALKKYHEKSEHI